jgi:hypothetical protein
MACGLALFVMSADAQTPSPKEWTEESTIVYVIAPTSIIKSGDQMFGTFETSGVRQIKGGQNMGARCIGLYDFIEKVQIGHENGACLFETKAGDQMLDTFDRTSKTGGTITVLSGTGKFKGITGNGEWKVVSDNLNAGDKINRILVTDTVHYRLP